MKEQYTQSSKAQGIRLLFSTIFVVSLLLLGVYILAPFYSLYIFLFILFLIVCSCTFKLIKLDRMCKLHLLESGLDYFSPDSFYGESFKINYADIDFFTSYTQSALRLRRVMVPILVFIADYA